MPGTGAPVAVSASGSCLLWALSFLWGRHQHESLTLSLLISRGFHLLYTQPSPTQGRRPPRPCSPADLASERQSYSWDSSKLP